MHEATLLFTERYATLPSTITAIQTRSGWLARLEPRARRRVTRVGARLIVHNKSPCVGEPIRVRAKIV